ncbi:MAG: NAD(P)H-binding protein [Hydrogenophilaceae bacterium]|jgi:nucleoside-diphosphate-sugar epimerase|nr:NAD(P)H-binding protein [Hydrogenophilaceae bacterium]
MNETISVLGGNGVYARHLLPRLTRAGHRVRAVVRRPEAADAARACGADVAVADIFDAEALARALEGASLVINIATSLPGPSGRGDFDANDRLRKEGAHNVVAACKAAGAARLIQQSIGFLGPTPAGAWSDEDTVFAPTPDTTAGRAGLAALAMEAAIKASGLDWLILRGGLFYGPGTGFDDGWHARAAAGKLRLPGDGSDYVSLVHIADMAAATAAAVRVWPSRSTFIVCDDEPAPWRDVFGFIAAAHGKPPPEPGGARNFPSFRMRNARARAALGWAPFHATYREGLTR